jgi:AraC family transcriptional regulator of adaptative response/methylated-DNA-[protein]-cysteine methyltransferase
MSTDSKPFQRTAQAIRFLRQHADQTPSLSDLADHLGLAPAVAQKEFRRLVGISPKRFLQDILARRASGLLDHGLDLLDASLEAGLSGPGRLHDHLIRVEAVSPGEWKNQGKDLIFRHGVGKTPFGFAWMLQMPRGIHRLVFLEHADVENQLLMEIRQRFPLATLIPEPGIQTIFDQIFSPLKHSFTLQVIATPFQLAVWKALLNLPCGSTSSYSRLAKTLGKKQGCRAVAQALAANPVAVLIPCHRVLREDGALCGYHWGTARKLGLLLTEET